MSIFKGIRFVGILVGWLVDEGLTFSSGFIVSVIVAGIVRAVNPYLPWSEVITSIPWYVGMFFLGNGCTVIGGFFTGCIAKSHRVKNGLALVIFEEIVHIYDWFRPTGYSLPYQLFEVVSSFASGLLGAWLAKLIFEIEKKKPNYYQAAIR